MSNKCVEINNLDEVSSEPRYLYYQGYDKAPALPFSDVDSLTTGTVIKIIGFYIGGPNYMSSDRNTKNAAISFTSQLRTEYLKKVKLAYLYVGRSDQGVSLKPPTNAGSEAVKMGKDDAKEAKELAEALDIPAGSVIYLDVEGGNLHDDGTVDYVKSWVQTINGSGYYAGIYCSAGSNCQTALQLYNAVNGKANMFVAKWMAASGYCYDMDTSTSYQTSYAHPAKWYDLDPAERVPGMGNVIVQYSGNVYISVRGVQTIVDQLSSCMADPSVRQFEI